MSRTPLAPALWQTSPREPAATRRPNRRPADRPAASRGASASPGRPNRRPPNRPARTRGAGDLAGRAGRTGRLKNEPYPARPRALADLPAGASRHQAAEPAAGGSPRREPRRQRLTGAPKPAAAEPPRQDPRRRRPSGSRRPDRAIEK